MTQEDADVLDDQRRSSGSWTPWQAIVGFGLVSLSADMVYEGMRAMAGPFLGSLGASALMVGVITGAGEGVALVLRLVTGPWADRSHRHWRLTVIGYAMTAVCVPLLAVTPFLGGAGLTVAATLILLERTGKAVRTPAKSALLARMAKTTGRGRGFGVHKALDQVGAFSGPLLLAGVAALTGVLWPGFAVLAIPGALSLVLLAVLRRRVPELSDDDTDEVVEPAASSPKAGLAALAVGRDLPTSFHLFSLAAAFATAGLMTFGVMAYRFVEDGLLSSAAVPLVYALGMALAAGAALVTGDAFDRWGPRTLLAVPPLVTLVPLLVFSEGLAVALVGIGIWGVANGVQDSSVKAYVADLVPAGRRATAYGVIAAVQGIGALAGGVMAGALITNHVAVLASVVAVLQVASLALLWRTTRLAVSQPG